MYTPNMTRSQSKIKKSSTLNTPSVYEYKLNNNNNNNSNNNSSNSNSFVITSKKTSKQTTKNTKDDKYDDSDDDSDDKPFKLPKLFGNIQDEDVYIDKNHIFFKADVSKESIDKLASKIDQINNSIKNAKHRCIYGNLDVNPIFLHITTNGGDLLAGFYGYDKIKSSGVPIHTIIEGCVASAGSILSIAGAKRYMTPNSHLLIHQLRTGIIGTYDELVDENHNCNQFMTKLINLYYENSNNKLTKKKLIEILKHDIFWNTDTSILNGLVDEKWTA